MEIPRKIKGSRKYNTVSFQLITMTVSRQVNRCLGAISVITIPSVLGTISSLRHQSSPAFHVHPPIDMYIPFRCRSFLLPIFIFIFRRRFLPCVQFQKRSIIPCLIYEDLLSSYTIAIQRAHLTLKIKASGQMIMFSSTA